MRNVFYWMVAIGFMLVITIAPFWSPIRYGLYFLVPYTLIGLYDIFFTTHNVLRNYPVVGHLRYIFEFIRPEIQQYFVATNLSGRPYSREQRSLIYQRSKKQNDTLPFGTQHDITNVGYESAYHSIAAKKVSSEYERVTIGGEHCQQPYSASRLNISAMSFGALSSYAIQAFNLGAKAGGFAHNTGEGGISQHHLQGGDLIYQLGTAYFGSRSLDGKFDPNLFKKQAARPEVKMIEIKLSQGAKPSHGGLLPGVKVDEEIAAVRGIPVGKDCLSPFSHSEFSNPTQLCEFIARLRDLSNGKPIGFKLCLGIRSELMGICKAMLSTGILPDFITIDGAEGGTGAAPIEYTNRLGTTINEAIAFIHSCLVGVNLRDCITLIASGKIATGFDMVTKIALGADTCNAARPFMFSVGCIQALRCNENTCPTGVTTQNKHRVKAIVPEEKGQRVANYHRATLESFFDLCGAMGCASPSELTPEHINRRVAGQEKVTFSTFAPYLAPGELLKDDIHPHYAPHWAAASPDRW